MEPPKQGRYELVNETVRGVPVVGVYWHDGSHRSRLFNLSPERVPLLAEALAAYLAGGPADAG